MIAATAFIFDLDGVITDTAELHYLAWKQLTEEEGIPFTRDDNDQLRGVDRRQSLIYVLKGKQLTEAEMEAWMVRKNNYYQEYVAKITPDDLLPGVGNFIQEAKARGMRLGLASASKNAVPVIERLGIVGKLDVIGDGYSVSNPKPAPDLFVWVAGCLGVFPRQAVVVEDAEAGIEAALRAGMYSIGLGPVSRVGKAHLVLPNLDGVHVEDVLSRMPASPR